LESFDLHPQFAYGHEGYTETHNYIDGKRSILEIYQAVQSELWSEEYPSFHNISLREVKNYIRMLEAAGIVYFEKKR